MINTESKLVVVDNSGAVIGKCIKVFLKNRNIGVGADIIKVSIQKVVSNRKIIKGQLFKALIVTTRALSIRKFGHCAIGKYNGIILLKKNENIPYSSRLKGSVFVELRQFGFSKLLSISDFVI